MKNAKKFQKFVEATRSLAFWSKELLKTIEQPDGKYDTRQKQIMILDKKTPKETKVAIVKKIKTMETTIPCSDGDFYGGDCCGCLNANYDEIEKSWIFRCNECNEEQGRGSITKRKAARDGKEQTKTTH